MKNEPKIQMTVTQRAKQVFEKAGGTLRAGQARSQGVHARTIRILCETGALVRISRGLYRLSDAPTISNPDLVVVAMKSPVSVICLISALYFHQLTTQIPHKVDIALPKGSRSPSFDYPPIQVYRFSPQSLNEGVETHNIDGVQVQIFSAAKTVADCFKFRNKIGLDIAIEALRTYCIKRVGTIDQLMQASKINRVKHIMMPYIEATL
jgi:predicted transcriptional regulator of viral defense system